MKLKNFRIKNYCSIIDSGIGGWLGEKDNITILAGQNESGKSSILRALRDFETGELNQDAIREEGEEYPEITCTFCLEKNEKADHLIALSVDSPELMNFLNKEKEFTLIRVFEEDNTYLSFDYEFTERLSNAVKKINEKLTKQVVVNEVENEAQVEEDVNIIDFDTIHDEILDQLLIELPQIIFFDDFCDLLPDTINLSDLKDKKTDVKGYQAVKNIEAILDTNFTSLDGLTPAKKHISQKTYKETITADFNEKWQQRIGDENGADIHILYESGQAPNASYLSFYVETRKDELLPPRKRSQGFIWFLSFWLHLKAESKRKKLLILFDEPGLYLHSKAQDDMIKVFEELADKNQIIYSTHSPYLIDTSKLNRVRLILNHKKYGTKIEKVTTKLIKNQKDALKPIIDAMGLNVAHNFSLVNDRNVIVEGISDFYYFHAMKIILKEKGNFCFIPAMGAPNVHLLMELCIGWGLDWLIIFDEKDSKKEVKKINEYFNNAEDLKSKLHILENADGIEDVFTADDMKLVNSEAQFTSGKKNSEEVKIYGGKELYARLFLDKVNSGEITSQNLSKSCKDRFKAVFKFINENFDE